SPRSPSRSASSPPRSSSSPSRSPSRACSCSCRFERPSRPDDRDRRFCHGDEPERGGSTPNCRSAKASLNQVLATPEGRRLRERPAARGGFERGLVRLATHGAISGVGVGGGSRSNRREGTMARLRRLEIHYQQVFSGTLPSTLGASWWVPGIVTQPEWTPPTDVYETASECVVTMEIAGLREDGY